MTPLDIILPALIFGCFCFAAGIGVCIVIHCRKQSRPEQHEQIPEGWQ